MKYWHRTYHRNIAGQKSSLVIIQTVRNSSDYHDFEVDLTACKSLDDHQSFSIRAALRCSGQKQPSHRASRIREWQRPLQDSDHRHE